MSNSKKINIGNRARLGWEKQPPDYRDWKAGAVIDVRTKLPAKFDVRSKCSPVRDQGDLGSCTGFAVTSCIEFLRRTDADEHSTIYSPLFAYFYARIEDGEEWRMIDAGAYLRDAAKIAGRIGVCPESAWPYDEKDFMRLPPNTAQRQAARWKSGTYRLCRTVEEVCGAIYKGAGVMGGFMCHDNMFTPNVDRTGIIPEPGGGVVGGHAVHFTGFDLTRRLLQFKNSWSEGWGERGYGYLPFSYVEDGLATDFWMIEGESPLTRQDR